MRSVRALIGLPAVVNGRKIGRVTHAELSDDLTQLSGLWISAGFSGTRFIHAENLSVIGRAAVLADDPGKRKRRKKTGLFRRAVGTDGSRLGAVTGAVIDELSFHVETLELSCGVWDDLLYGRRYVRRFTLNQQTGDIVIDVSEIEKEVGRNEERNDEGPDCRRSDRRLCRDDVRHQTLADCTTDESSDEEDR